MAAGAIDICNFDASWGGGPTEWRRVAALAQSFNVGVAQHIEPQIGAMLVAGARNGTFVEALLPWRDPFFDKLIADQKPFRGGKYPLAGSARLGLVVRHRLSRIRAPQGLTATPVAACRISNRMIADNKRRIAVLPHAVVRCRGAM